MLISIMKIKYRFDLTNGKITLMRSTIILSFILLLTACGSDPFNKYLGYWQREGMDEGRYEVLEITQEGENYLLDENIFVNRDMRGRPKQPRVLRISEEQLLVKIAHSEAALAISDDEQTLRFFDLKYTRIAASEANDYKLKMQEAEREKEQNNHYCPTIF